MNKHILLKVIVILLLAIAVFSIFFLNIYGTPSSEITPEMLSEFNKTAKTCSGISILLNPEEVAVDAVGRNLCIGILKGK